MRYMSYRRPQALGMTRIRLNRRRRRVLAVLLTGAVNLHGERLCTAAGIWSANLYPFLGHLEASGWVTRERRKVGSVTLWCYDLTGEGRIAAAHELNLVMPARPLS